MSVKNTQETYGTLSKSLHWVIAVLILGLILVGLYMQALPDSPDKFALYVRHKSFGLLVLWLAGLRLLWRFYTKRPAPIEGHEKWEKFLSKTIHIFLYAAMFGMPLTGWVMSSAAGYPVPFFGFQMPDIVPKNAELSGLANKAHFFLAYLLMTAIFLHVLGALKHHIIDGDETLERMAPNILTKLWQFILIILLVVFGLGVLKLGIIDKFSGAELDAVEIEKILEPNKQSTYDSGQWSIVKEQSQIQFKARISEKEFTGIFSNFDGTIIFKADDLKASKADIRIYLKSVDSGDIKRDSNMLGEGWFNVADHPISYFITIEFQKGRRGALYCCWKFNPRGKNDAC